MHAVFRAIIGFLRLGPIPLGLIAAAFFGAGIWLQMQENQINLEKAEALLAGPPPAVNLSDFNPVHDIHPFDEVAIRAQLDLTRDAELTLERRGNDDLAVMVPLVAVDAVVPEEGEAAPEVLGVALFTGEAFAFDDLTRTDLRDMAREFGAFGPVLTLNGRLDGPGDFDDVLAQSFAQSGAVLAPDALHIYPYMEGRVAAFDAAWPFQTSIFGAFAWIGGAFGVFALFKLAFRSNRRTDWSDEELFGAPEEPMAEPSDRAFDTYDTDTPEETDAAPRSRSALRTLKLIVAGFVILWGAGVLVMLWQTGQFAGLAESIPGRGDALQTLPADQQTPADAGFVAQARALWDRAMAGDQYALMILAVAVLLPLGIYGRVRKLLADRRAAA